MTSGHFVQKCRAAGMFPPPSFRLSGGGELTATTRLITHHISKGETVAQSLKDRFDYGQNPEKTQGGELISAYECDHRTADAEFLLAKAKYKAVTGREQRRDADVLCYQIRQSFRPGEITPEEANRVGYETAMRWTKGKHAFFVATHTDRQHIHNHIYYNSTTLDYTGKFRDFFRSAAALRRLSDRVCLEHDLSVIQNPKLHSKGRFLHYGQWVGERPPSAQQRVRLAIVEALGKQPADFAAFLRLMEESGFAVKRGRGGVISFLAPGQDKPTRLRSSTLGPGFDPEDIRAVIAGERPIPELPKEGPPPPRRVDLIIDIQNRLAQGKGPAYERWAKVYNLKQMAAALLYLREHGLTDYAALEATTEAAVDRFHSLAGELRDTEAALSHTSQLMGAVVKYAKTRPVFDGYKAARYSKKYLAQHEAELSDYRAAKAAMSELLDGAKLPKMDALKKRRRELSEKKKALYAEYRKAQADMREAVAVKGNIDFLRGYPDGREDKAQQINIVAFYSRADENYVSGMIKTLAIGNTEIAAGFIAKLTGADTFKIEQAQPYSKNYNECIAQAQADQNRNARPELKAYPETMEQYSEIYLGFPNYWGTMPMAVFTFLEHFDFSGKIIKPFCTHEGSGLGGSINDIRKLCPEAKVETGLAIRGGSVKMSKAEIEKWI